MKSLSAPPTPRPGAVPAEPTVLDHLRSLLDDIPRLVGERVQLLTLELKRARQAFVVIAAAVVIAVLTLLTTWFVLWGAAIAGMIQAGLAWGWAVLIVIVVNLVAAIGALMYASSMSRFLSLPATARHLTLAAHDPGKAKETPFTAPSASTVGSSVPRPAADSISSFDRPAP